MTSISMKNKFQRAAEHDKFAAADQVMAQGGLSSPPVARDEATSETEAPTVPSQKAPAAERSAIVRETFSMPPSESVAIDETRMRMAKMGILLNRSEVIRAGLAALARLDEAELTAIGEQLTKVKRGRPR